VPFVFSPQDPAKQKVDNKQVKMAGARRENRLMVDFNGLSSLDKNRG
jgi:hypothetical protein